MAWCQFRLSRNRWTRLFQVIRQHPVVFQRWIRDRTRPALVAPSHYYSSSWPRVRGNSGDLSGWFILRSKCCSSEMEAGD